MSTPDPFTPQEIAAYVTMRIPGATRRGDEWRGPCPVHKGDGMNFAVNGETGESCCHSKCQKRGWNLVTLEREMHGGSTADAYRRVCEIAGRQRREPVIEATYDYKSADAHLVYQVLRFAGKEFRQRRPDGIGGWLWNMDGVQRTIYKLPEVLESPIVFVVEGEKDVETLRQFGFVATCNSGGAGKWLPEFGEYFKGREVFIIPDNDPPGRRHALDVARSLLGKAVRVVMVELPGTGSKDITAWFAAGHSEIELVEIVDGAAVSQ